MPSLTLPGAFETLSHQLGLASSPQSENAQSLEAFLRIRASIKALKSDVERQATNDDLKLSRYQNEFEFVELVLERLRTFVELPRQLTPIETATAMSALHFLTRRLTIPYEQWDLEQSLAPDIPNRLVNQ